MQFINPRTDFAFKKIFGSAQSKPILLSFLNALLHDERPVIVDLEIIDPYLAPKIQGVKDTFVDVRARLQDGRSVIIEMQVLNDAGFEKRVLYNAAKSYSTQLQPYVQLCAVVALTITDFVMFPEHAEVQSAYVLKEKTRLTDYREGDLELVFVELPKFQKQLDELAGVKEKWLYFLRHAPDLKLVPAAMEQVPELNAAFQMANEANMTTEELHAQEMKLYWINSQRSQVEHGKAEGRAEGLAEGRADGLAEGRADGLAEGLAEGRALVRANQCATARQMLGQMTDQQITALTGLPLAEVIALRAEE